jgi:hypothetical protein
MIDEVGLIAAVSSLVAAVAGAGISTGIAQRIFRRKEADITELLNDLSESRVDRWNDFRASHPGESLSLGKIDLSNRDLSGVDFSGCNLEGADFSFSDLQRSNFKSADLKGADFEGADISMSSFEGASLKNANFRVRAGNGADLEGVDIALEPHEVVPTSTPEPLNRLLSSLSDAEPLRLQSERISVFISELHGYEFETFVKELMRAFGFESVERLKQASDVPDLFVSKDDPFFTASLLVEMKSFRRGAKVGVEAIHQVINYLNSFSSVATGAVIVTNTGFSASAQRLADESPLISLVDNRMLTLAVDQYLSNIAKRHIATKG